MSECHLCLLGLIALSSLLTGVSGENETHVFIRSGEDVRLPCNNALHDALHDCNSTTWIYYNGFNHSAAVELITLGIKRKDRERHERLSLGSDCSLNIRKISTEDYGSYTCQQWTETVPPLRPDARVYLDVLHVSSSQTQISSDLSCQLYLYPRGSCDEWISSEGIHLFWVNQADVKPVRSSSSDHCIISLTTTLLNEDHNREWRCEVTHRDQVKTSVTITVKRSDQAQTTTPVSNSQDPSTTNTPDTSTQTGPVTALTYKGGSTFQPLMTMIVMKISQYFTSQPLWTAGDSLARSKAEGTPPRFQYTKKACITASSACNTCRSKPTACICEWPTLPSSLFLGQDCPQPQIASIHF
ncbi:uncharacterized protein LOC128026624 [Carassius gibelio]|uniref:uncharacterized protein LOC128026624 n=1 Tax=Carassius gibelio TaxID=101364 RepID=UPI002277AD47|nr:uncharacterized protein LOC128026624 [Carassius gibelio]